MISERNVRFFAVLSMIALFCAGVGVGFAIDRFLIGAPHRPPPRHGPEVEALLGRFAKQLDLTDEQKRATHEIMEEGRIATERVVEGTRPELDAIRKTLEERIAALLNTEQAEKYHKMLERGRGLPTPKKGKGKGKGPRGHPPPPGGHLHSGPRGPHPGP